MRYLLAASLLLLVHGVVGQANYRAGYFAGAPGDDPNTNGELLLTVVGDSLTFRAALNNAIDVTGVHLHLQGDSAGGLYGGPLLLALTNTTAANGKAPVSSGPNYELVQEGTKYGYDLAANPQKAMVEARLLAIGQPGTPPNTIAELVYLIELGLVYTDVHTVKRVSPAGLTRGKVEKIHPAPVEHKPAPIEHQPAPVEHPVYPAPEQKPAPVEHPVYSAPVEHKPAPVEHPTYPAPEHKPAPVEHPVYPSPEHKPAPVEHKPAPVEHPVYPSPEHKPAPEHPVYPPPDHKPSPSPEHKSPSPEPHKPSGDAVANANAQAIANGGNALANADALAQSNGGSATANANSLAQSTGGNAVANSQAQAVAGRKLFMLM